MSVCGPREPREQDRRERQADFLVHEDVGVVPGERGVNEEEERQEGCPSRVGREGRSRRKR